MIKATEPKKETRANAVFITQPKSNLHNYIRLRIKGNPLLP